MTDHIDLDLARALGDRHLRDDHRPSQPAGVVRLVADDATVNTRGGQHALWMATNLLARQFAIVEELVIDVARAPLAPRTDPFDDAGGELGERLVELARSVAGAAMRVSGGPSSRRPDVDLMIGSSTRLQATRQIAAFGDGWRAMVGPPGELPRLPAASSLPFGPYFAACLGTAEVFKMLCGRRDEDAASAVFFSLWDGRLTASWSSLATGAEPTKLLLPPSYLIGAGAVGQAFLAPIIAFEGVQGYFVVIDDDAIDLTNLNRYLLARLRDVGCGKVDLAVETLERRAIGVHGYQGLWPAYALDPVRSRARGDLDELERTYGYRQVISCVDGNQARHDIQRFWPEHIIGASTQSLRLTVASYDLSLGDECLMCANPIRPERTIEDLARDVQTMPSELRRAMARTRGVDVEALEEFLREPHCGLLGEAELRHFAAEARADWSVGFVSVGAGVLAAAKFVQQSLVGRPATWDVGSSLWVTFRPSGARWMRFPRREDCECSRTPHHRRLWGNDRVRCAP